MDDIACMHDDSGRSKEILEKLRKRFPFGEWKYAAESEKGIDYTGKQIWLAKDDDGILEARIGQRDFVEGRLEPIVLDKQRSKQPELECTLLERSQFRSGCGSLQWVAGLTRPGAAYGTNMLQKKQAAPTMGDMKECNKLIADLRSTSDACLRIRAVGHKMIIGVWTDSALHISLGEEIEVDEQLLKEEERHNVRSQAGAVVGCFAAEDEDKLDDIKLSLVDWRTRATKRVATSTFAAETSAACDGLRLGLYIRAMICEIYHGPVMAATQWGEDIMKVQVLTDCKASTTTWRETARYRSTDGRRSTLLPCEAPCRPDPGETRR